MRAPISAYQIAAPVAAMLAALLPAAAARSLPAPNQFLPDLSTVQNSSPAASDLAHQKRNVLISKGCVGKFNSAVKSALTEAADMGSYVYAKLLELEDILRQNPVPDKAHLTPAQRTLFNTFEAFFGQVYYGTALPDENVKGIERVEVAQLSVGKLDDYLHNPSQALVEIWCHEGFLSATDPQGEWPGTPGQKFDSRKWTEENPIGEWASLATCEENPGMTAYHYAPDMDIFGEESVVVLCPEPLNKWSARYGVGDQVGKYHSGQTIRSGGTHLDHLWGYLPVTILHEFSHSTLIMTGTVIEDKCLANGLQAYQWACIHQLSKENPGAALLNSDTISLFMAAIYFNMNDWSTGVSQPLGFSGP